MTLPEAAGVLRLPVESVVALVGAGYLRTTTSEDGSFSLTGIPAGTYTLKAIADEKRVWEQPVTISADRTLEIVLPPR